MDFAAVGSREIDGNILTLSASGWTYLRTFVLWDYETETLWFPKTTRNSFMTGINGEYADRMLNEYNSSKTTWKEWKRMYPNTKYMKHVY